MRVETERLLLRELLMSDLEFVAEMLGHPEVMRYWPRPYTRDEAIDWIHRWQSRYEQHGIGYWLTVEKQSKTPIGQAGLLRQIVDGVEEVGLGYIIHRPFWRQGFATEASAGCLDYAFQNLDCSRVIALIRPENAPSQGVARKLGMTVEKSTIYAEFEHLIYFKNRP